MKTGIQYIALILFILSSCSMKKNNDSIATATPDAVKAIGTLEDKSDSLEVIKLETGKEFRFKGLAIDVKAEKAYLGSWDKKEIVVISLKEKKYNVIKTKYSGILNGMGTYIKNDKLYAVMNDVDDNPQARPISALLVIDLVNQKVLHSYEAIGANGRHHFNHVTVDEQGIAYISNTLKSSIYTVNTVNPQDHLRKLVEHEDLSWIHGIDISPDGSKLFSTSYHGGIKIYDLKRGRFSDFRDTSTTGDDGLKYYQGCLYGIGNNALKRYTLNDTEDKIVKTETLLYDHEFFNDPRCLSIVGGYLYCLGNIEFEPVEFRRSRKMARKKPLNDSYLIKLKL
jgi:hypothetical protein